MLAYGAGDFAANAILARFRSSCTAVCRLVYIV